MPPLLRRNQHVTTEQMIELLVVIGVALLGYYVLTPMLTQAIKQGINLLNE